MHVRLIDANSVGYAQHHANDTRLVGELQTQAILGVLNHVRRHIQKDPGALNVMLWDGRAQWRYDKYPAYKSGRHHTEVQRQARAAYEAQRPWIQKALRAFPVIQLRHPHAEADDLGFGLAHQLAEQGHRVSLYTADSDWLQSVGPRIQWVNARNPAQVVELDGYAKACGYPSPHAVALVKALAGDSSDDIEGVPDVADKRALTLLGKYGTLEALLEAAQRPEFKTEAKYYQALTHEAVRARVLLNRELVDLRRGPPLEGTQTQCMVGEWSALDLYEVFVDLEHKQWQDAFPQWERALSVELPTANVFSFKRALASLSSSWAAI